MGFHQQALLSLAQQQGHQQAAGLSVVKWGYITSFNPATYAVRVRLEPDSTANADTGFPPAETNWLPLFRPYGGNGWGDFIVPKANPNPPYGDACLVLFPDHGQGLAISSFYTDVERPPLSIAFPSNDPVPASHVDSDGKPQWGERMFYGPMGNRILILNDGSVRLYGKDTSSVLVDFQGDGSIRLLSSAGDSIVMLGGTITIHTSGGAQLKVTGSSGSGTTSDDTAVVTRRDLQDAINALAAVSQALVSAAPTPPTVKGSTSVTCTN